MLPSIPLWFWLVAGLVSGGTVTGMLVGRAVHGRKKAGIGRLDVGRLIGVVGLPGFGKTSFIMHTYVVPQLKLGRRVLTNFTVMPDETWTGTAIKMLPSTFGSDLLGLGSSLNVDEETGLPMSGWFMDTACTCGKGHSADCANLETQFVPGVACCKGFIEWRQCSCNGVVLVIDESHSFLPASQSKPLPIDLLTWLTMCRKNHLQIIWATQYYKWVHAAVRRLTDDVYMCEKRITTGDHVAKMHHLDRSNGNLMPEATSEVRYSVPSICDFYDTSEVIIPAGTAYEIAGQMNRKNLGGSSAKHAATHPRPAGYLRSVG